MVKCRHVHAANRCLFLAVLKLASRQNHFCKDLRKLQHGKGQALNGSQQIFASTNSMSWNPYIPFESNSLCIHPRVTATVDKFCADTVYLIKPRKSTREQTKFWFQSPRMTG